MIADPHLDPVRDQLAGDVGLQIGEADRQVRLQRQDFAVLALVNAETRGFSRRAARGPHRKS